MAERRDRGTGSPRGVKEATSMTSHGYLKRTQTRTTPMNLTRTMPVDMLTGTTAVGMLTRTTPVDMLTRTMTVGMLTWKEVRRWVLNPRQRTTATREC